MKKPKTTYSKMPMYVISKGNGLFYNNREGRYLSKEEIESYRDVPSVVKNETFEKIVKPDWINNYYGN